MKTLRLYWANGKDNFGDMVAPILLGFLFRRDVEWAGKWSAEILGIGSILGWALLKPGKRGFSGWVDALRMRLRRLLSSEVVVFGSGFLHDPFRGDAAPSVRRDARILAVRGRKTLEILRRIGLVEGGESVALGDPGLFFADLWPDVKRDEKSVIRAYIPHESEWGGERLGRFFRENGAIRLIDVRKQPKEVFTEIAGCAEVFSSSLHGLIAADSLGIPNQWVAQEIPGRLEVENRFKFDDYYSAFGEMREPCHLDDVPFADCGTVVAKHKIDAVRENLLQAIQRFEENR